MPFFGQTGSFRTIMWDKLLFAGLGHARTYSLIQLRSFARAKLGRAQGRRTIFDFSMRPGPLACFLTRGAFESLCSEKEQDRRAASSRRKPKMEPAFTDPIFGGIRVSPAGSVSPGSDSPPGCHSLPGPFESLCSEKEKTPKGVFSFSAE